VKPAPITLPTRPEPTGYVRAPVESQTFVPDHVAELLAHRSGSRP